MRWCILGLCVSITSRLSYLSQSVILILCCSHLNSIDKFPDGDYLLSGRRSNTIYKVSANDGSIVWRLGGHKSDFDIPIIFSGQHAAKIYSQNDTHTLISFLDNAYGPGDPKTTHDASRGLLLSIATKTKQVEVVQEFKHPHHQYAKGQGNVQWLEETGHAWTCWQGRALHTEHTLDGSLIMEAEFKAGVRNYRSFKFPWVGRPSDPPDVRSAAVQSPEGVISTIVAMSWNGATEVHEWNVYSTNPTGLNKTLVAQAKRSGFETTTWVEGYISHLVVEAVDIRGTTLGESEGTATVPTLDELAEAIYTPWSLTGMLRDPIVLFVLGMIASAAVCLGTWGAVASFRKERWHAVAARIPFRSFRQRPGKQAYETVPVGEEFEIGSDDDHEFKDYSSPSREGASSSSADRKSIESTGESRGMLSSKDEEDQELDVLPLR